MYSNKQSKKLFQLKDIVTISLIIILLLVPTSNIFAATTYGDSSSSNASVVSIRDLVILNQIANIDLENVPNYSIDVVKSDNYPRVLNLPHKEYSMVTYKQLQKLKFTPKLWEMTYSTNKENAYNFLFDCTSASAKEVSDWTISDYVKIPFTTIHGRKITFCAMTFKKDNVVVIAFRGPETKINGISKDIFYELLEILLYSRKTDGSADSLYDYTRDYVRAATNITYNSKVYLTGWGIGGYMAQIAGAQMLKYPSYKGRLIGGVIYFNSMGIDYPRNLATKLNISDPWEYPSCGDNPKDDYNILNNWYKNRWKSSIILYKWKHFFCDR